MHKDDLVYIGHMADTARKAASKVQGKTRSEYDQDENLRLALAHLIQVLGEAARRVSPAFQQAHPELPWKQIVGMRHKVVHDYLSVDFDTLDQLEFLQILGLRQVFETAELEQFEEACGRAVGNITTAGLAALDDRNEAASHELTQ
jgi:uncharacterized protein with HEPN domain